MYVVERAGCTTYRELSFQSLRTLAPFLHLYKILLQPVAVPLKVDESPRQIVELVAVALMFEGGFIIKTGEELHADQHPPDKALT